MTFQPQSVFLFSPCLAVVTHPITKSRYSFTGRCSLQQTSGTSGWRFRTMDSDDAAFSFVITGSSYSNAHARTHARTHSAPSALCTLHWWLTGFFLKPLVLPQQRILRIVFQRVLPPLHVSTEGLFFSLIFVKDVNIKKKKRYLLLNTSGCLFKKNLLCSYRLC